MEYSLGTANHTDRKALNKIELHADSQTFFGYFAARLSGINHVTLGHQ